MDRTAPRNDDPPELRLGDEAVALGALDAGVSAVWGYPGTPASEIVETVLAQGGEGGPAAGWTTNEKTAYEAALGAAMVGRRALAVMKHVGLNVAADAFVSSALLPLEAGLVLAVGDDPGMHSSQNEQDSRFYADFARVPCLEPRTPAEAYAAVREAFAVSERFGVPVMVRLVTRLAHTRGPVRRAPPEPPRPVARPTDRAGWVLLPANARRRWRHLLDIQPAIAAWSEGRARLAPGAGRGLGVVTCGLAGGWFAEAAAALAEAPWHLHLDAWPPPVGPLRALAAAVDRVLVLEEGGPLLEQRLPGLLGAPIPVLGRATGHVPPDGELGPDVVRAALGLPARPPGPAVALPLPARPPQLCAGCPHRDAFDALALALADGPRPVVTGDIGCYTLGALPPYQALDSCVCMGASIAMARGAFEAGAGPTVAVIGDGTLLHSGLPALVDLVARRAAVTVIVLDNRVAAMTGAQPTAVPPEALPALLAGLGVDPAHVRVMEAHPRRVEAMAALIREEVAHLGPSVIVFVRECLQSVQHHHEERRR